MSTIIVSLLRVSCLCFLVGLAVSSHFRGGIIQWRPVNARAYDGNVSAKGYAVNSVTDVRLYAAHEHVGE